MVQILLQKLQILIFSIQRLNVEFPDQRLPQEIIDRPGIDLDHPALFEKLVQVLAHRVAADVQHRTHFLRGKRLQHLKVHLSGLLFQIVVQLRDHRFALGHHHDVLTIHTVCAVGFVVRVRPEEIAVAVLGGIDRVLVFFCLMQICGVQKLLAVPATVVQQELPDAGHLVNAQKQAVRSGRMSHGAGEPVRVADAQLIKKAGRHVVL